MCIGPITTGTLENAVISAVIFEGLQVQTADGRPARLAILDEAGNVIECGHQVAEEAWNVAIASYKNFLAGNGHLRVQTEPPGLKINQIDKAA
ncbi:MAG: hypothetical protein ACRC02_17840 [Vogesella sp.]|uniref:hypothetical protein n=1 Tax=Vogesella sp. TaxID=1904252 RepID=UPI003F333945